jgi:hypothetical protein
MCMSWIYLSHESCGMKNFWFLDVLPSYPSLLYILYYCDYGTIFQVLLDIQVLDALSTCLDKGFAGWNLFTHQGVEDMVSIDYIINIDG